MVRKWRKQQDDAVLAQLFNSDTEGEEFEGFVDGEWTEKVSFTCFFYVFTTEQGWEILWIWTLTFEQRWVIVSYIVIALHYFESYYIVIALTFDLP